MNSPKSGEGTAMLDILLGSALDGGTAWRHLLDGTPARAGWFATGPVGLVRRLGTVLGVPRAVSPWAERLRAWDVRLHAHDDGRRFYSASRARDRFGVAAHLLALRDRLRLGGWDGSALGGSRRLEELSALERPLPPGLADGVLEVRRALEGAPALPLPLRVELADPREHLPPLVQDLLALVEAKGGQVSAAPVDAPRAPKGTDLARLQAALLGVASKKPALEGDGTVLVLEADTPLEAAELLAAWTRANGAERATLVVPDEGPLLDAAFRRQGLPALGLAGTSRWRPALQLLPLRLALAFHPRDPLRAVELLSLPTPPLPGYACRALLAALQEMPGIDGPEWRKAVDACAERAAEYAPDEPGAAAHMRERIDAWFGGTIHDPDSGVPAGEAAALCRMVARWAGGRAQADEAADPLLVEAAGIAASLERVLATFPPEERIAPLQLDQLHDAAVGDGASHLEAAGEVGRPALCAEARAVLPDANDVVWWGFVGGLEGQPAHDPWTEPERAALAAAGVRLAPQGAARAAEAWGWRRPALAAAQRLVLVRWRLAGVDQTTPHPFADELVARLADGWLARCTLSSERVLAGKPVELGETSWKPKLDKREPAPPLVPRGLWRLPAERLVPKTPLSYSSVNALFGCPLTWTLEYIANLRPGLSTTVPDDKALVGTFAHALLHDLFFGAEALAWKSLTPEAAADWIAAAFDARVETEAAPLVRPGRDLDRARAREAVAGAAKALVELLRAGGWKPSGGEVQASGKFAKLPIEGWVDFVAEKKGTKAVLDFKFSGAYYKRRELVEGKALQLALYGAMISGDSGDIPPAGFLVLDDARLLTTSDAFPGVTPVAGPSLESTVKQAMQAWGWWRKALGEGLVPARLKQFAEEWQPECEKAAGAPPPEEGPAAIDPPCRYCNFTTLCNVRVGGEP